MEHPNPASHSNGGYVPHELAARLLESHFPYTVSGEKPLVFAGGLLEEMPFEVPTHGRAATAGHRPRPAPSPTT